MNRIPSSSTASAQSGYYGFNGLLMFFWAPPCGSTSSPTGPGYSLLCVRGLRHTATIPVAKLPSPQRMTHAEWPRAKKQKDSADYTRRRTPRKCPTPFFIALLTLLCLRSCLRSILARSTGQRADSLHRGAAAQRRVRPLFPVASAR